jgi:acyl-coenzyme A synthetase/AMP-(fatty) acid ligase
VRTLFHSAAFDFSVWEIWGALLYGGRLVVVPYFTARAPEEFLELLRRERVTVLNQTPSAFRQLVRVATAGSKQELALRYVVFGGEALELQSLKPWFELYGDRTPQLVNMYGITETTVHVTYRPLTAADLEANSGSVIGQPLADLRVYLLDPQQQLVPVGVPGEMYVGGGGLSRGYLRRHDLTAERFVPDMFSNLPGAKLYRSGDLARRLANGDLEYLGRVDRQVKIRGFRIELGEIEAVLRQAPGVEDCVVLAGKDSPASLLAYLVLDGDASMALHELRSFASSQLPDYMVPSFFMQVERIPLTANGKSISERYRCLRLPLRPTGFVAPQRNRREVGGDLSELLGRDQIGITANLNSAAIRRWRRRRVPRPRYILVRLTLRSFRKSDGVPGGIGHQRT